MDIIRYSFPKIPWDIHIYLLYIILYLGHNCEKNFLKHILLIDVLGPRSKMDDLKDDEDVFSQFLTSVGVEECDPLALAAIIDYARSKLHLFSESVVFCAEFNALHYVIGCASEILCDAKDFASHCNRDVSIFLCIM
jgi:hypothetical protein